MPACKINGSWKWRDDITLILNSIITSVTHIYKVFFLIKKKIQSLLKNIRPKLKSDIFSTFGSSGGGRCE